jgi:isoleucyl-tRNA synthetase
VLHPPRAGEPPDSIFFHTWKDVLPAQEGEAELVARWKRVREIRAEVVRRLEEVRTSGGIGSSLQANAVLEVGPSDAALLRSLGGDLKYVFITSTADVRDGAQGTVNVLVAPSSETKCERCWHYRPDVNGEGLCGRCVSNLKGPGESRRHA